MLKYVATAVASLPVELRSSSKEVKIEVKKNVWRRKAGTARFNPTFFRREKMDSPAPAPHVYIKLNNIL